MAHDSLHLPDFTHPVMTSSLSNYPIPLLLAHGEGLISALVIMFLLGAVALISLICAGVCFFSKRETGSYEAGRFIRIVIACILLWFFVPVFVRIFHLP